MTIFPLSKASSIWLCSMSAGNLIVSFSLRNEEQLFYRFSDRKDLCPHQTTSTIQSTISLVVSRVRRLVSVVSNFTVISGSLQCIIFAIDWAILSWTMLLLMMP